MAHSFAGLAGEFPDVIAEIFELTSTDPEFRRLAEEFEDVTHALAEAESSIEDDAFSNREALQARRDELRETLCAILCDMPGDAQWCDQVPLESPARRSRRSAA